MFPEPDSSNVSILVNPSVIHAACSPEPLLAPTFLELKVIVLDVAAAHPDAGRLIVKLLSMLASLEPSSLFV